MYNLAKKARKRILKMAIRHGKINYTSIIFPPGRSWKAVSLFGKDNAGGASAPMIAVITVPTDAAGYYPYWRRTVCP